VVLDDVPQGAGLIVIARAGAYSYVFGDGDLDVVHVVLAPDRLEDAVGEAQGHDILHRLLAEVVIYPVDLGLLEVPPDVSVKRFGAREIPAERLLEHDARPSPVLTPVHPRLPEPLYYGREERRR
jgi:hypothetical protein